jgi:hypothetical protein
MNRLWTVLLLAATWVFLGADDGARTPAARFAHVKGKATVIDPEKVDRPAVTYGTAYADDRLVVAKDTVVVLVFGADGHFERINKPGTYRVSKEGCQPRNCVERLPASKQNRSVSDKAIKGNGGIVQGGVVMARGIPHPRNDMSQPEGESAAKNARAQIFPIPGSTILTTKPVFTWPAVAKAAKYTVTLYFHDKRVWSGDSATTKLAYAGEAPLTAGGTYSWEVTTVADCKASTVCDGMFTVAGDEQRKTAEALEKLVAQPDIPYLAVAAMWYRQNEMVGEAIAANERLAKLADDAGVYWALMALYAQAGRDDDSRAAEERAATLEKKAEGGK